MERSLPQTVVEEASKMIVTQYFSIMETFVSLKSSVYTSAITNVTLISVLQRITVWGLLV